MIIREQPSDAAKNLLARLNDQDLGYGDGGTPYSSFVTPASVVVTGNELSELSNDLLSLWRLYETWNSLYLASLAGDQPAWIASLVEQGLSPDELLAHRMTAAGCLRPRMCRVDYISLGDERKIAEVQWRTGGPGLFLGIYNSCCDAMPLLGGESHITDDVVAMFCDAVWPPDVGLSGVAVNTVSSGWLRGERYLRRAILGRQGSYIPVMLHDFMGLSSSRNDGDFYIENDHRMERIAFLGGHEFSRTLPREKILSLASGGLSGQIWIEVPLNYIFRQKWGLAFPFMSDFRDLFDDRLRSILAPTALLTTGVFDLRVLVPYLPHSRRDLLQNPCDVEEFINLPASLRGCVVFKCGSGVGPYYNKSKGVFRVSGSRSTAREQLLWMVDRIMGLGEPWIAQVYIDAKYPVLMCPPWMPDEGATVQAHARFMIFGKSDGTGEASVVCGLANFDGHWNVTGRPATIDARGRLKGSSFTDIRVSGPDFV